MIIADSSALVALSVIDRLNLLEDIFKKIYVPRAVYNEVTFSNKPQAKKLKEFLKDKVIDIELNITQIGLGQGELEAIALYKELKSDFLLIDDIRAKKFAKLNGVNTISSLGVLVLAKELNIINTIKQDLEKLQKSDIYISKKVIDEVLEQVKE
jgi:predicted nucleic acid-binding protein